MAKGVYACPRAVSNELKSVGGRSLERLRLPSLRGAGRHLRRPGRRPGPGLRRGLPGLLPSKPRARGVRRGRQRVPGRGDARMRRALVVVAAVVVSVTPAHAYVLTRTDAGAPVRWPMRCIVIAPDARGDQSADEIDQDIIDETLARSVSTWNARTKDCSFIRLGVVSATRALEAVSDGR